MDWPLTAALGSLAAAMGVAGYAAVSALQSDAPQSAQTRRPAVASIAPKPAPRPAPAAAPPMSVTLPGLVPGSAAAPTPPAPPTAAAAHPVQPSVMVLSSLGPSPFELHRPPQDRPVPQPSRPQALALPPLKHEPPPPKIAKPVVAPAPAHKPPSLEPHVKGVMTAGEIARIRSSLRLTAEQLPLWRPVEAVLREIGREQMAQVRLGGSPEVGMSAMQKIYYAAQSLLATLRPDQKEQVRRLARSMGYASVASML